MMGEEAIEVEAEVLPAPPRIQPLPTPSEDEMSNDVEHQRQLGDFSHSDHRKKVGKKWIVGGIVLLAAVILAVVLGVTLSAKNKGEASDGSGGSGSSGSSGSGSEGVGVPEDFEDNSGEEDVDLDEAEGEGMQLDMEPYEEFDQDNSFPDGDIVDIEGTADEKPYERPEGQEESTFFANDDTFTVSLDTFQEEGVELIDVLTNDSPGEDGDRVVVYQITEQAMHGSCIIDFDLEYITYTPRAGDEFYVGDDACVYQSCTTDPDTGDRKDCDVATLTIAIEAGEFTVPEAKPALSAEAILDESVELIADAQMTDAVVAIYGDTAIVGSPNYDETRGTVIVFARGEDGEWTRQATLTPPNAEDYIIGTNFGWSVDIYEDTIIVGAWGDTDDVNFEYNKGSAHVFVREDGAWTYQAKLTADDADSDDMFGHDVAVHGNTAIVSAMWDDDSGEDSGAVYVFARDADSGEWTQQSKLLAPDGESYDDFGNSIDIYEDTVVIGAFWDDEDGAMDRGSVHVFERDGDEWAYQTKLTDESGLADDHFGNLVAIDGDTMVIGARRDDDEEGRKDIGAAHVFVRDGSGWTQQSKLVAPDGDSGDQFGNSVDIYGDTILVAARFDDDSGDESGSVHVYVSDGNGGWEHQAKLVAPEGESEDFFGFSTRIYDGTIIVGSKSGEMHVFEY